MLPCVDPSTLRRRRSCRATDGVARPFVAIVLAIVALVKRTQPRWLPITAIVVAPIAWLIAIVVAVSGIAVLASGANQPDPIVAAPTSQNPEPVIETQPTQSQEPVAEPVAEPTPTQEPAAAAEPVVEDDGAASIGETITNEDGISFTVTSATCGIPYVGDQYLGEAAIGQFCEVRGAIANGSNDAIDLYSGDFTGEIAVAEYEASGQTLVAGDRWGADVNPGLSVEVVVCFDVPQGAVLAHASYAELWSFLTSDLRFRVG